MNGNKSGKRRVQRIVIFALLAAMLLALTACGGNDSDKADNRYTFATWAAGTELAEFKALIDEVNEEANGKYTIEVLSIPSDYYIKIASKIAAKNAPDMFWLTQELVPKYAEMGAIANITEQFEASENLTPDMYYEGVLASATYDGSYWGHPWIANPIIIYCNKTMFDELGIACPTSQDDWTWSEFIDVCRQISGKTYRGNSVYGTVIDGWPNIETFFWAGGGDIIAEDNTTITIDTAEAANGMAYLQTILSEGLTPRYAEVSSLGDNNVWFEKQRVAMYMGGIQDGFESKVAAMSEEDQFEIVYAPMPVCDDGQASSFDWTASTVLSVNRADDPVAYEAMEAVTRKIFSWKIAAPIKDSLDNITELYPEKAGAMETIEYTMENARSANYIPEWSDINDRLWYDLYAAILNDHDLDYKAVLKELQSYSERLIAERG